MVTAYNESADKRGLSITLSPLPHPSESSHRLKTKNMPRNSHDRKLTPHRRFRDVSHMKLTNIFKSLRPRRTRREVSLRSPSTYSRSSSPFADHDISFTQPLLPDLSASSYLSRYRSDAASIPSATKDYSAGTSTSSPSPGWLLSDFDRGVLSSCSVPSFPTSPTTFRLRSVSTQDYLVDRLEKYLGQLHLGDVASPDHKNDSPSNGSHDIPMDICLDVTSPRRKVELEITSRCVQTERNVQQPTSLHDQNFVPMILITSVDAKHAKPLPPSARRLSRTPLGPSNSINYPANVSKTKEKTMSHDDPFTTRPELHDSTLSLTTNLAYRLPNFPLTNSYPYVPETPTPMHCDHIGDCRGDLWEILHPPLVSGRFTLPPFRLPPLSTGLFGVS